MILLARQGKLGAEFDVEQGQECARVCAINIINQVYECLLLEDLVKMLCAGRRREKMDWVRGSECANVRGVQG